MLIIGLILYTTAAALTFINVSPIQLTRCATLIYLSISILIINQFNLNLNINLFDNLININSLNQVTDIFICIIAAINIGFVWAIPTSTQYSMNNNYITSNLPPYNEYSVILFFTTFGASILISCQNLITLFLGLELQSFAIYILCSLYRNSESSSASALKYFFIGGLSSAIILLGGAIIYNQTGSTDLNHIYNLVNQININNISSLNILLGFNIILLGSLMKIAAVPFHFWAPDVYDGVPTVVTIWLSIIPKISLFIFILNITINLSNYNIFWHNIWSTQLAICSILSLIVGTIVGLVQIRIKRLLTYSTISHIGFILLALSIITKTGSVAFIFYLAQYTISTLNCFLILLAIGYNISDISNWYKKHNQETDIEYNDELTGQFRINPILGICFTLCLFSIVGVPPLIGFFGKQSVLIAAIESGYGFLAIIGIVTSVISASYYLNLIRSIQFNTNTNTNININNNNTQWILTRFHSYIIATLTIIQSLFWLTPSLILDSTNLLALTFFTQ